MKHYVKAIDYVQWVWKKMFGIEHSKTKIRADLKQGAVQLNGVKVKETDVFELDKDN